MGFEVIGGTDVLCPDHCEVVAELSVAYPGDADFEPELVAVGFLGDDVEDLGQRLVGDRKHRVGHGDSFGVTGNDNDTGDRHRASMRHHWGYDTGADRFA